jgi:cytochrome c-type biogenesis protein CcmH
VTGLIFTTKTPRHQGSKRVRGVLVPWCLGGSLLLTTAAFAVTPDERLADQALEARARAISVELRCLVCQNQSIDDSNADLAHDLRVLVRERLVKGDSDRQVIDYIHARYGDYVLLKPPVKPATWALWFGPPAIVLAGAVAILVFFRRRRSAAAAAPAPLTAEEQRRLATLLDEGRG